MDKTRPGAIIAVFLLFGSSAYLGAAPKTPEYAGDLGPASIDVSAYPPEMQAAYGKFQAKCGVCHSAARAVNSELITADQWNRYIKRMWLRPPCCNFCPVISKDDAKTIWKFLTYDSTLRKTGSRAAAWEQYRQSLLAEFKKNYPKKDHDRYELTQENGGQKP